MRHTRINKLLTSTDSDTEVTAKGWIKTFRNNQFLAINDGSCLENLQVVIAYNEIEESTLKSLHTGAAVSVTGLLVESLGKGQRVELKATSLEVLVSSDPDNFPLQPKKQSL